MYRTRASTFGVCLLALLLLSACGGGGGGDSSQILTLESQADLDGVVDVSGFLSFDPRTSSGYTGDLEASFRPGYYGRQLFAFPLGTPADGIHVISATLRLYQGEVEGDPYGKNGVVVVDHVNYVPDPGADSYDGQTLERHIGTLSTNPFLEVKTVDVTEAVRADVAAGRTHAQFRLRFHNEIHLPIVDSVNDYVRFTDAEGRDSEPTPELVIRFNP